MTRVGVREHRARKREDRPRRQARRKSPSALKLGAANRSVRVSDVTLLSGGGRTAVAVKLTSSASHAQREVPLLVTVTGVGGKVVYTNATRRRSAAQRRPAAAGAASAWWVDDQVLTSQTRVAAQGARRHRQAASGSRRAGLRPRLTHGRPRRPAPASSAGSSSTTPARRRPSVPVFAVALRGGKIVAAGRAVVDSRPAHGGRAGRLPDLHSSATRRVRSSC